MNSAEIIKDCEDRSKAYSTNTADRLAYEVGCLQHHIWRLCKEMEYAVEEIGNIEKMLMKERE